MGGQGPLSPPQRCCCPSAPPLLGTMADAAGQGKRSPVLPSLETASLAKQPVWQPPDPSEPGGSPAQARKEGKEALDIPHGGSYTLGAGWRKRKGQRRISSRSDPSSGPPNLPPSPDSLPWHHTRHETGLIRHEGHIPSTHNA